MPESSYRPWGMYESLCGDDTLWVKVITVLPHNLLSLQIHHHRDEHWIIWDGEGEVVINGWTYECKPHSYFYIPAGTSHRMVNPNNSTLKFIEIAHGKMDEDDIVRLDDIYGR